MMKNQCESCLLPFAQDPGKREHDKFCSLCFKNGKFCFEGTGKEFRDMCYKAMITDHNIPKWKALFFVTMIRLFAPRWKKK